MMVGLIAGIFSGIIPAAGNFTAMIICLPIILSFSINELILFYMVLASTSQYFGSITAILFGIPGESSSIPAVLESRMLPWKDKLLALNLSTIGSFIGSVIVFICLLLFSTQIETVVSKFYSSYLISFLLAITAVMVCTTLDNKWLSNFINFGLGILLNYIGFNQFFGTSITFGISYLASGLPFILVVVMFLGIPEAIKSMHGKVAPALATFILKLQPPPLIVTAWSVVIGSVAGLIPGLTTDASSNISYSLAKFLKHAKIHQIYASETANNAGAVTQILPLLLFGIPILGSEAMLLTLLVGKGFTVTDFPMSEILQSTWWWFFTANITAVVLCFAITKILTKRTLDLWWTGLVTIVLMVVAILDEGYQNSLLEQYFVVSLILLPMMLLLKNRNNMPLVFGFMISDNLVEATFRSYFL